MDRSFWTMGRAAQAAAVVAELERRGQPERAVEFVMRLQAALGVTVDPSTDLRPLKNHKF